MKELVLLGMREQDVLPCAGPLLAGMMSKFRLEG